MHQEAVKRQVVEHEQGIFIQAKDEAHRREEAERGEWVLLRRKKKKRRRIYLESVEAWRFRVGL